MHLLVNYYKLVLIIAHNEYHKIYDAAEGYEHTLLLLVFPNSSAVIQPVC
jgi:hypothetical protein